MVMFSDSCNYNSTVIRKIYNQLCLHFNNHMFLFQYHISKLDTIQPTNHMKTNISFLHNDKLFEYDSTVFKAHFESTIRVTDKDSNMYKSMILDVRSSKDNFTRIENSNIKYKTINSKYSAVDIVYIYSSTDYLYEDIFNDQCFKFMNLCNRLDLNDDRYTLNTKDITIINLTKKHFPIVVKTKSGWHVVKLNTTLTITPQPDISIYGE